MNPLLSAIDKNDPIDCTIENGYCVFNVAEQWNQILKSKDLPLFSELKNLIRSLTQKIDLYPEDNTSLLYDESEWQLLCKHRGPVETIAECKCLNCNKISYSFGTSGFIDVVFFVNEFEKKVIIEDPFDNDIPPEGYYLPSQVCPFCGGEIEKQWGTSPYAFFQQYKIVKSNF